MLVEKVESGRGEGGSEIMVPERVIVAVDVAMGFLVGTLSAAGTGRLRLRTEEVAEEPSANLDVGSGGGGDGGGDCW